MTRARAILATTAAMLLADVVLATTPPRRPCESEPALRQGFSPAVVSKLARVMRQATAAVPRAIPGDRCRVTFEDVPALRRREACWEEPQQLNASVDCESSSAGPYTPTGGIVVTLSRVPLDYQAEGEILESTPDLLVTATRGSSSAMLIFGARGEPWVDSHGTMRREAGWTGAHKPENASRGPFIVAIGVWVRSPSAETTRDLVRRVDRPALLKLLRSEVDARRAARLRARR